MTNQRPLVGLAIIARDEAENLPVLLDSINGAFDRVVLMDTGSKDATIEVFIEWAQTQVGSSFAVGRFEWTNDFAEARKAADMLLLWGSQRPTEGQRPHVDWTSWADCDDRIVNADRLRDIAAGAASQISGLIFGYDYAQHPESGACVCHLRRERLVRAGAGNWVGRVHEAQLIDGLVQHVPDELCHWHHRKQERPDTMGASNVRNLKILRAWVKDEPENARVLGYLGVEHAIRGKHQQAIGYYRRYLKLQGTWTQERAQIHRRYAASLIALERFDEAEATALQAIAVMPEWPDSYLTLAEVALTRNEHDKVLFHAQRVLELGEPDTLLIINPLDYRTHPYRLRAAALAGQGQFAAAVAEAQTVLAVEPDQNLMAHTRAWMAESQRKNTADTYVMAARQLIAHDEQVKALTLLEQCVPAIATDHADVVALRSEVRERLLWTRSPGAFSEHYETGGSKPEDFLDDEQMVQVCRVLPRVGFLIQGLRDQLAA